MASKHVARESNFEVFDSYFLLFNDSRGTCTPLVQSFFFKSTKGAKYTQPSQQPGLMSKKKYKQPPLKNKISKSPLRAFTVSYITGHPKLIVTVMSDLLHQRDIIMSYHLRPTCYLIWLNPTCQKITMFAPIVCQVTGHVSATSTQPFKVPLQKLLP